MSRLTPAQIILVMVCILGVVVIWLLVPVKTQPIIEETAVVDNDEPAPAPAPVTNANPVSLYALMNKDFDGRDFEVGNILAEEDEYTRYAITYMSGDLRITGIMNVPKGDGPFPVLFLNHGYIDTDIYTSGRGLRREQDYFAKHGFVVVHSDYRNHAGSDNDPDNETSLRLGYTEDVINAVLAIQAAGLDYVNPEEIGMLGHSMGGGIAQNVAVVDPDLVDAFVLYAPVSGNAWANFNEYTSDDPEQSQTILSVYGGADDNPEFWSGVSAENFYERINKPVLIHIGTKDESTPPEWSYSINDKLQALNKNVELQVYESETHEFGPSWSLMMDRSADFFEQHLLVPEVDDSGP